MKTSSVCLSQRNGTSKRMWSIQMLNEIGPRTENFCKSKIEWKDPNERIWIGDRYYTEEQYKERRAYRRNLVDSEPQLFVRNKFSKQKSKAKLVRNLEWA